MSKIKLLVEIDEDEYKIRKEMAKDGFDSAVTQMIVNGTPYNPTGDCISREALKKHAIWTKVNNGVELIDIEVVPLVAIDNAPTVPLPNEQTAWEQGYEAGLAQGKQDRPQGEWIFKNGKYRCTACEKKAIYRYSGSLAITQTELLTQFCPICGADMRKGGAE